VIAAATVGGPRHGFLWAALSSLLIHLVARSGGAAFSDATAVALLLVWGSAAMPVVPSALTTDPVTT
jgi:hypothetical protein